jgi:hypothetical protein
LRLYRKIGIDGNWEPVVGANGDSINGNGTSCWISHNMGADSSTYSHFITNVTGTYEDMPNTTNNVYYTAFWKSKLDGTSGKLYLNKAAIDDINANYPLPSSSWTATEIWNNGTPYTPTITAIAIAHEKVGISKANSSLVIGDENPDLFSIWNESLHAKFIRRGEDFECVENQLAVGGRSLSVRTSRATYSDIHLPLHGMHQGSNASIALAAVEEFFDAALNIEIVREGFSAVAMPGRFEVLGRQPLVVVDGAHNPAGADVCAEVFFDDFSPEGKRILVVGTVRGRDPEQLLSALRVDEFDAVICCTAPTARGLSANELGGVARQMGCDEVVICDTVENACEKAINMATEEDAVLVAGSLYVVGSARTLLRRIL